MRKEADVAHDEAQNDLPSNKSLMLQLLLACSLELDKPRTDSYITGPLSGLISIQLGGYLISQIMETARGNLGGNLSSLLKVLCGTEGAVG